MSLQITMAQKFGMTKTSKLTESKLYNLIENFVFHFLWLLPPWKGLLLEYITTGTFFRLERAFFFLFKSKLQSELKEEIFGKMRLVVKNSQSNWSFFLDVVGELMAV